MTEALDLLGDPIMRCAARFHGDCRLVLSRTWGPGPRALTIGCNPSTADARGDDPTSLWWNAWFQLFGFGGYDAVNLYPFCTPSPAECRQRVEAIFPEQNWHDRDALIYVNGPLIAEMAKAAAQVFVCWGNIAWDDLWIEHVIEEIQTGVAPYPDLWCWGKTLSGAPKHPMARGQHRIPRDQQPILWRTAA